jgi:hypothetical protein
VSLGGKSSSTGTKKEESQASSESSMSGRHETRPATTSPNYRADRSAGGVMLEDETE